MGTNLLITLIWHYLTKKFAYTIQRRVNQYESMDREEWKKIEPILDKALSIEKGQKRKAYLKYACRENKHIFKKTKKLLKCISVAEETDFLE